MGKVANPPKDILIQSSKMFFLPPEIFRTFNATREFIARTVELNEIYPETFADAHELRYLILSFNKLKILVDNLFVNQSELLSLKLQHNEITSVYSRTFYGLNELRSLVLSFNRLRDIPLLTFRSLKNLEVLQIDNNLIIFITGDLFMSNLKLMHLNFEYNEIASIDNDTLQGLQMFSQVNMVGNGCVSFNFASWEFNNDTANELSCCFVKFEDLEDCLRQKASEEVESSTVHIPLIILLFISIFVNILVISLFFLHKQKSHGLLDNEIEMIEDLNGSAVHVYW